MDRHKASPDVEPISGSLTIPKVHAGVGGDENLRSLRRLADPIWVFVALGCFLRVYQYLWNRSLFFDEAALALNLRTHSFAQLAGRLDHSQFGPLGFLYLQKILRAVLGESEYVLRAPALAAGLLSLPLIVILARRVLPEAVAWLAIAAFALSRSPIFWSADAKPYMLDVVATLVLLLFTLDWLERPNRRNAIRLGIAGAVSPYFSAASFLVLAAVGLMLAERAWRRDRGEVARVLTIWLAAIPAFVHSQISLSADDRAYFKADWWDGFLPLPFEASAPFAYTQQLFRSLADPLGFSKPAAFVALVALFAGLFWMLRHSRNAGLLLLVPVILTWVASMAGLYPIGHYWLYHGRVVLFLAPIGFILIAAGVAWIRRPALVALTGGLIIFLTAVPAALALPYTRGEVRRALEYLEPRVEPGDVVYLFYPTALPVEYYGPELGGNVYEGICAQDDRAAYLRDVERLRGKPRAWVLTAYGTYGEDFMILDYLRRNAITLDSSSFGLAEVRLFDFRSTTSEPPHPMLLNWPEPPNEGTVCRGIFAIHPRPRDLR